MEDQIKRKLASVRKVKEVKPIKGADLIELAIIDGWQVVVKKGEFKKDDLGVYFEIDSLLEPREEYSFLEKSKWRIKTIRLRKELSQGLLLKPDVFKELENKELFLGQDLTELLNVKKYVKPINTENFETYGPIPSHIKRTGEERIQNIEGILDSDEKVYITEKIDGTSTTFFKENDEYYICSHNQIVVKINKSGIYEFALPQVDFEKRTEKILKQLTRFREVELENLTSDLNPVELQDKVLTLISNIENGIKKEKNKKEIIKNNKESSLFNYDLAKQIGNVYFHNFEKYNIKEILDKNPDLIIQGESVGPNGTGSNGNYYKLNDDRFYVFNIRDKKTGDLLSKKEIKSFVKKNNLLMVPIIEEDIVLNEFAKTVKEILEKAEYKSHLNNKIQAEGFVIRSESVKANISFKVVSNSFLLKNE